MFTGVEGEEGNEWQVVRERKHTPQTYAEAIYIWTLYEKNKKTKHYFIFDISAPKVSPAAATTPSVVPSHSLDRVKAGTTARRPTSEAASLFKLESREEESFKRRDSVA